MFSSLTATLARGWKLESIANVLNWNQPIYKLNEKGISVWDEVEFERNEQMLSLKTRKDFSQSAEAAERRVEDFHETDNYT